MNQSTHLTMTINIFITMIFAVPEQHEAADELPVERRALEGDQHQQLLHEGLPHQGLCNGDQGSVEGERQGGRPKQPQGGGQQVISIFILLFSAEQCKQGQEVPLSALFLTVAVIYWFWQVAGRENIVDVFTGSAF